MQGQGMDKTETRCPARAVLHRGDVPNVKPVRVDSTRELDGYTP